MICISPIKLTTDNYYTKRGIKNNPSVNYVRCGKCFGCQQTRSLEWTARLNQEALYYKDRISFVTLTYDPENCPSDYGLDKEYMSKWFNKFAHSVKRKLKIDDFKYFYCGEYGSLKGRPHYHAIFFGIPNRSSELRKVYRHNDRGHLRKLTGEDLFIHKEWNLGDIQVGKPTAQGFKYVSNYMQKNAGMKLSNKEYFKKYGRIRPYLMMSKGIGKRYCLNNIEQLYGSGYMNFQGRKMSLPRIYKQWIYEQGGKYELVYENSKEYYYAEVNKRIKKLYDSNPHIEPVYITDFANFSDYFDIRNHPELYKVVEKELSYKESQYNVSDVIWKSKRRLLQLGLCEEIA